MEQAVTMKDIARALDISVVSVSKALSGKKGVSEETRALVIKKADEIGYNREPKKQAYASPRGNIGIVVAECFFKERAFYAAMYSGLLKQAAIHGYVGILEIVDRKTEAACAIPRFILGNKVTGIIIMGEMSNAYVEMIAGLGCPNILLDFYTDEHSDSVVSDGMLGAFKLTRYLIDQGHRDIGFVGSRLATSSIMDRFLGYYKAMLQQGPAVKEEWLLKDRNEEGHLLASIELPLSMPTAFVCNCDETANVLMDALKERKLHIPGDVSVVGFDDFRFATLCRPALTTFHVNIEEMCQVTMNRLARKIGGKPYTKGRMVINGAMVARASTDAPPQINL